MRERLKTLADARWEDSHLQPDEPAGAVEGFDWLAALLEIRDAKGEALSFAGVVRAGARASRDRIVVHSARGAKGRENRDANALSAMRRRSSIAWRWIATICARSSFRSTWRGAQDDVSPTRRSTFPRPRERRPW